MQPPDAEAVVEDHRLAGSHRVSMAPGLGGQLGPHGEIHCPGCNQLLAADSRVCWACGAILPTPGGSLVIGLLGLGVAAALVVLAAFVIAFGTAKPATGDAVVIAIAESESQTPATAASPYVRPSNPPGEWIVGPGDTLVSIASTLGVSHEQLRWWNLSRYPTLESNPMAIQVGWILIADGPAMPTPTPKPTREPAKSNEPAGSAVPDPVVVATPEPTQRPSPTPQAPAPTPVTGWDEEAYTTALAYLDSLDATYPLVSARVIELAYFGGCLPGSAVEECAAAREAGALLADPATAALNRHVAFMDSNPAAPCFVDAYAADRALADRYLGWLATWAPLGGDGTPAGRAQLQRAEQLNADFRAFFAAVDGYFADCG